MSNPPYVPDWGGGGGGGGVAVTIDKCIIIIAGRLRCLLIPASMNSTTVLYPGSPIRDHTPLSFSYRTRSRPPATPSRHPPLKPGSAVRSILKERSDYLRISTPLGLVIGKRLCKNLMHIKEVLVIRKPFSNLAGG